MSIRFFLLFFLGLISTCFAQNWLDYSVPQFLPQVMKETNVGLVNIYEVSSQLNQESNSNGHLVRIVKFPTMSFSFDEEGNMIEKLLYRRDSDAIVSRSEMNYQKGNLVETNTWTYLYNPKSNGTIDTIVALHKIKRYKYDEDQLVYIEQLESNGDGSSVVEKTMLSYNEGDKIQSIENQYLKIGDLVVCQFDHQVGGKTIGTEDNGLKTVSLRDDRDRFVKVTGLQGEEVLSDESFYYKETQLDSTHGVYNRGEVQIGKGFYYDRLGRLALVRIHHSNQGLTEKLFEYFPREDGN